MVAHDQLVQFANQDSIHHIVHTYVLKGRHANILRTIQTQNLPAYADITQAFDQRKLQHEKVIALTCDRHPFMENWLYVVESPYFAVSEEAGNFGIDHVPSGSYDLVAWHPVLGTKRRAVRVRPDENLIVSFSFTR